MPKDIIDLRKFRMLIAYTVYMIIAVFLQDTMFSSVKIFNVKPFLIPAAVCAVGLFEDTNAGAYFGFFIGLIADRIMGSGVLLTIIMPFEGFAAGVLSRWLLNKSFLAYMALATAMNLICGVFQGITVMFLYAQYYPLLILWKIVLQAIVSLPFAAIFFYLSRITSRLLLKAEPGNKNEQHS